jgi:hypothetical protein
MLMLTIDLDLDLDLESILFKLEKRFLIANMEIKTIKIIKI